MSTFQPPGSAHGASGHYEGGPYTTGTSVPGSTQVVATAARLQGRGLVAVDGALALISILLIVQMWLVTAALESFLAGHHEVAVPAALISGLIFGGCGALYLFVDSLDAHVRESARQAR